MRRRLVHRDDREILRLAVPALGALAAEPLYVLADTAVVGHLGTPQLGGLAVASAILLGGYSLFIFLAYGTTASVARLVGAGEHRQAAAHAVQGLWLALGVGVLVAAVGLVLSSQAVTLMGASDEVRPHALTYLRISLLGVPPLLLTLAATGYLRGLQDTRTPLVVAVASVVANLVIELVLIYGAGWGIEGSAWATVVAQLGAALVYGRRVARDVRGRAAPVRPDPVILRRLAGVSTALFLRTAALRATLLVATAAAARIGTVELGAHHVAFEVWSFLALVLDSIAIAAQAMIGRLLGAGRAADADAAARRMIEWGVAAGAAVGVIVVALRPVLAGLFTADPEVAAVAAFLLVVVASLQPVNGAVFVLDGILIGAGDMRFLAWAMVGAATAFLPAAVAVVVLDLGVSWLWAALALLMGCRLVALGTRFVSGSWAVTGPSRR